MASGKRVQDIMTTKVFSIDLDVTLKEIKEVFDKARFHHVLVKEKEQLVGVISDRDILKSVSPFIGTLMERQHDLDTLKKRAHQIMQRKLVTALPTDSVEQAAKLMLAKNVSCLPVLSKHAVVGIVTLKDIVKALI